MKLTPAEIITAMPHTLVYAYTTLYGLTVMPEKHAEDCAVCRLSAANTAYLETVVREAMEKGYVHGRRHSFAQRNPEVGDVGDFPPIAEVLAAADAKFREGA